MSNTLKYNGRIDGLRAIAVILVILQHYLPERSDFYWSLHFGRMGVVLFFIISGYLITNILLTHREQIEAQKTKVFNAWRTFYLRRALRIFPLYYAAVFAMALIGYPPTRERILWHLFYFSNFGPILSKIDFGNLTHFWSLCVEEQFYLIVPLPILLFSRQRSLTLISIFAGVSFIAKVLCAAIFLKWKAVSFCTFSNIEGLFYGALLAYGLRFVKLEALLQKLNRYAFWLALAVFIALMFNRFMLRNAAAVNNIYYICLIDLSIIFTFGQTIYQITRTEEKFLWLNHKILRYIGKISYGLYVYHFLLLPFIPKWLGLIGIQIRSVSESYQAAAISVLVILGVAAISWHCIEAPILKLKNKVGA